MMVLTASSLLSASLLFGSIMQAATLSREEPGDRGEAAPSISAEAALEQARRRYSTASTIPPGRDCEPAADGVIVVCAATEDPDRVRIPSRLDKGDDSHLAKDVRAPDFAPPPCVPNLLTLCPKLGAPPPPVELIDVTALPEAPVGSDADLIARGEKPPR